MIIVAIMCLKLQIPDFYISQKKFVRCPGLIVYKEIGAQYIPIEYFLTISLQT